MTLRIDKNSFSICCFDLILQFANKMSDSDEATKSTEKATTEEHQATEEEAIIQKVIDKLEPKMNQSFKNTMLEVLEMKRNRDDDTSSRGTIPYEEDPEDTGNNQEDILSIFARSSFRSVSAKKVKLGDPNDSISTKSQSSRSKSTAGSIRSESKSPGFNRKTSKHTGSNRDDEENKDPSPKIDIVEELMRQCEDEIQISEDYGPNITTSVAERAVRYFTKGAKHSETRNTIFKKHKLAANMSAIDTPKMNPGVLKLGKNNKMVGKGESTLFNIQNNVTRAAMAVTNIINMSMLKEANSEMIHPKEVTTTCLETISLLGYVSKELSHKRKDNMRSSVHEDYRSLCDHDHDTTKFLLGDDLSKGARDAREIAKLGNKKKPYNPNSSNKRYSGSSTQSSSYSKGGNYPSRESHQPSTSKPSFLSKGGSKNKKR